jgi:DNA-binding FrmR family transcriptional regulator
MGEQLSSTKRRSFRSGMSFRSSSWNSQGIKSEVNSSSWINTHFSETALGETNPDHKWQIRNVLEAGTPFSANKYQVSASPWSFTCSGTTDVTIDPLNPVWFYPAKREDSGNGVYWDGQWPSDINSNSGIVTPLTGSAQNLAIDKLYGQLQAIQSSVQAGEDLGEIKQTYSALKKPMASLTSLINRLTYVHNNILADYNDSKRLAKALADTALEWKFGWKPLASTIAGAIVGLQGRDYISDYFPFSASGSAKTANRGSSTFGIGTLTADVEKRWGFEVTVKYKGMWGLQAGVESRSVQDVLSLRPRDIIPTVWNLIPYSFLVDYVSNIGTIMNAFSVPWDGVRWCS